MPPMIGLIVIFSWIIGLPILFRYLHKQLERLWPSVELQTGYQYLQLPSNKRIKAAFIISGLVLPVIVAGIYDLVKSALGY